MYAYNILEPNVFGFLVLLSIVGLLLFHVEVCWTLKLAIFWTVSLSIFDLIYVHGAKIFPPPFYYPPEHDAADLKCLVWLLVPLSFQYLSKELISMLCKGLFWLAVICTIALKIFTFSGHVPNPSHWPDMGVIYNPSMNPSLIWCLLPFGLQDLKTLWKIPVILFCVYLLFDCHSVTPSLVAATVCMALIKSKKTFFAGLGFLVSLGLFLYLRIDWNLHTVGRFHEYGFFWSKWREYWNPVIGMGPNKFEIFGPALQYVFLSQRSDLWCYLHSDWFTVLVETGIVGLILWSVVYVHTILSNFKNKELFALTLGLGTWMLTYFPLHSSSGVLVAVFCLSGLSAKKETIPSYV